jgi:hypothetical protein
VPRASVANPSGSRRLNLSLQILDSGETFLRPLDSRPLVLGSAEDADLRLTEPGIAPRHARIEPVGSEGYRIVDLGSEGGTRVNGRDIAQARLAIGDRVEIGSAVLVVGQQVARRATADDVLEDAAAMAAARARPRRAMGGDPKPRRGVLFGVGAAIVVVLGLIAYLAQAADVPPTGWGDLLRMRREGDVPAARRLIDRFRRDWAGDKATRLARLDAVTVDLDGIESRVREGATRIRAEASTRSSVEQEAELRRAMARGDNDLDAIAAKVLLSQHAELRLGISLVYPDVASTTESQAGDSRAGDADAADRASSLTRDETETPQPADVGSRANPSTIVANASQSSARSNGQSTGQPTVHPTVQSSASAATSDPATDSLVAEQLKSIRHLASQDRFAEAFELCSFVLAGSAADVIESVQAVERELRTRAESAFAVAMGKVEAALAAPAPADQPRASVDAALVALHDVLVRFPADGVFARAHERRRQVEALRDEIVRRGESAGSAGAFLLAREGLDAARQIELQGDYQRAAIVVREAATKLDASDPEYAGVLRGRADDLEHLHALVQWLRSRIESGAKVELPASDAGSGSLLVSTAGERLVVGDRVLDFAAIDAVAFARWLSAQKAASPALLGGAVVAFRADQPESAEALLVQALSTDKALAGSVSSVLARGRGEIADAAGYTLVDGRLIAVREIEARKRGKALVPVVHKVARLPDARRDQELDGLLAKGPRELDAVVIALREVANTTALRIEADPFRKFVDQLAERRRLLDEARREAKDLIYDEVRYFYPYRAPAVSGEKESEYWKVQAEVDARVAKVRELWDPKAMKAQRVPKKLTDELRAFDWTVKVLNGFGERIVDPEDRVSWLRGLPTDRPIDIRSFAWDAAEAARFHEDARVTALNQRLGKRLGSGERESVALTNEYRALFGHRLLAINEKLVEAARSHAKEMGHMGYFSHFSPIPERRSPFDRMKLAGYSMGSSENIANYPSAAGAHNGWLHSSGHHRNLLHPSHTEFAIGNDGRLFVANFGRGEEYREAPEFR